MPSHPPQSAAATRNEGELPPTAPEDWQFHSPLAMAKKPTCLPDSLLSEKLNWRTTDLAVILSVSVDSSGQPQTVEIAEVEPSDELAKEWAALIEKCFQSARFEGPPQTPYSFQMKVEFRVSRSAQGRQQ